VGSIGPWFDARNVLNGCSALETFVHRVSSCFVIESDSFSNALHMTSVFPVSGFVRTCCSTAFNLECIVFNELSCSFLSHDYSKLMIYFHLNKSLFLRLSVSSCFSKRSRHL